MKTISFYLVLCCVLQFSYSQVGVGTTNPQAQLEVANGNVRFSSYGNGSQTSSTIQYVLGVEADGDIVETNNISIDHSGLQYYTWDTANLSTPNITNVKVLGQSTSSGLWSADLNDSARSTLAPDTDGYLIRFVGTLKVVNTGNFTFIARSDDGTRVYIDDVLVVDNWFQQSPTTRTGSVNLAKGEHRVEFWYYENSGGEFMEFTWGANPDGYTVGSAINASTLFVK